MKDETLFNISLGVAMIGLIILLLLSFYDKIPEKSFNEITSKDTGTVIKTTGTISQIYTHNNSITLKLKQECLMDVIIFDKNKTFNTGEVINIQGIVQEYNGKQEIIAEKIVSNK